MKYSVNELYSKYENLRDEVGAEKLLEEIIQEMDTDQMKDMLESVCRAFDVDFDEI